MAMLESDYADFWCANDWHSLFICLYCITELILDGEYMVAFTMR